MNIEDFSKEIEKLLTANEIKMMVTFPEGGMEPIIKTNIPEFDSAAIHFYLILHIAKKVFKELLKIDVVDASKKEDILEGLFEMLKAEILEEEAEESESDKSKD